MSSSRGHSPLEQRTLHVAIKNYAKKNKLTLTQIAANIQAKTGVTMYDVYLRRLGRGELSASTAEYIYQWYTSFADRSFSYEQKNLIPPHSGDQGLLFSTLSWRKIPSEEASRYIRNIRFPEAQGVFNDKQSELLVCWPSFLHCALYRLTNYGFIPSTTVYFVDIDDCIYFIADNFFRGGEQVIPKIHLDSYSVFEWIELFMEASNEGAELVLRPGQAAKFLDARQVLDYHHVFEAPKISQNETGICLEVDTASKNGVSRHRFDVSNSGRIVEVEIEFKIKPIEFRGLVGNDRTKSVFLLRNSDTYAKAPTLNKLFEIAKSRETGFSLVYMAEHSGLDISEVSGIGYFWHLSLPLRELTLFTPQGRGINLRIALFDFAYYLRSFEQSLLKLDLPDPAIDMLEYASVAYAKSFDAAIFAIRTFLEFDDDQENFPALREEIKRRNLLKTMQGYIEGLDWQQLFEIYKSEAS